jgi:hypothetical protein
MWERESVYSEQSESPRGVSNGIGNSSNTYEQGQEFIGAEVLPSRTPGLASRPCASGKRISSRPGGP